mgnify:CR=1 FL=1
MIWKSKYKRRIEVARWKANIRLNEINKELANVRTENLISCMESKSELLLQIRLLDSLLKGKEVKF